MHDGRLDDGAADFRHIRSFFVETGLTLVGLAPNDPIAGNDGHTVKVIAGRKTVINPDSRVPDIATGIPTACRLHLPTGDWQTRLFDPRTGQWPTNSERQEISGGNTREFKSPFSGDAVLLLTLR